MAFDWTPRRGQRRDSPVAKLVPSRVLYDFDGPIIFDADVEDEHYLFYKADEDVEAEASLFLAVPTNDSIVDGLATGGLSLRTALSQARTWVIECDLRLHVNDFWVVGSDKVPNDLLPEPGYGLSSKFGLIKDHLGQKVAPFLSVHFEGKHKVHQKTLPLSVFVKLVNEVAEATYHVFRPAIEKLAPDLSDKARRRMLAIPVYEPGFGSLLIAMEQPRIDRSRVRASFDIDDQKAEAQFLKANNEFLEEIVAVAGRARKNRIAVKDADVIELLAPLVPTEKSYFDQVTIEGRGINSQSFALTIDLESGQRIWDEFSSPSNRKRTQSGKVVEVSDRSSSFILRGRSGREVTCIATLEPTVQTLKSLRNGMSVTVAGNFEKRVRRDKLYIEDLEVIRDGARSP